MAQALREFSTACSRSIARGSRAPGCGGGDFEIRDEEDKMELRGDGEHLACESAHDVESAETRGRGVIGMAFQSRAKLENFATLKRTIRQLVQSMENAEPDRRAAAESARRRHLAGDRAGKGEGFRAACLKKASPARRDHWPGPVRSPPRDRDLIVKAKRDAEAVEARAEIRCARRNADGDLLHDW